MNTETRQYKDVAGNVVTLEWLVKNEPEWAANQIRHRDNIELDLADYKAAFIKHTNELAEILAAARKLAFIEDTNRCSKYEIARRQDCLVRVIEKIERAHAEPANAPHETRRTKDVNLE